MARVVEKKKLNRFHKVSIPRNKDLFFRVGKRPLPNMNDGQVADFNSVTINHIDHVYDTYLNPNRMPLDEGM